MNEELNKITEAASSLLKWAMKQGMEGKRVCYLLYHIRNDVYVPILVSDPGLLTRVDYYLAFSRLQPNELSDSTKVKPLECNIPILLQRGRIESLSFEFCEAAVFWQELIPLTADNSMVLVRSSCNEFAPISQEAREFALHWSSYAHSQWNKAGNTFFPTFLEKAGLATCHDVLDHIAQHLGDKEPFPPFYEISNFQVTSKFAGQPDLETMIRCNPLGFNTGIVLDFTPKDFPWIPTMPAMCYKAKRHYFEEYLPDNYSKLLPKNPFYLSIIKQTEDFVLKVCEFSSKGGEWHLFARHNRKRTTEDQPLTFNPEEPLSTDNPFLALAKILCHRPLIGDYLVTLWAVNSHKPLESLSVGSEIDSAKLPKLSPFDSQRLNPVIARGSTARESLLITFQPATGCDGESMKLLREKLQNAADAALKKIQELAPAARLKAIYTSMLDRSWNWNQHFPGNADPDQDLHEVRNFKRNATEEQWRSLGARVIEALNPLAKDVALWPCLTSYDSAVRNVYVYVGKSFAQGSICPELAACFAGSDTIVFDVDGYYLLRDSARSKTPDGAAELAAGLILLGRELRSVYTEVSPTFLSKEPRKRFKLGSEGSNAKKLEEIQEFARCCFNDLPPETIGKQHFLQTAAQLIRPFARVFSGGFVLRNAELYLEIYAEFNVQEKT